MNCFWSSYLVLQYEGDLEKLNQSCKLYEVKKVECVWNNRMEGDLLYLGMGAGFTNFNRQISDAESTVSSSLFIWVLHRFIFQTLRYQWISVCTLAHQFQDTFSFSLSCFLLFFLHQAFYLLEGEICYQLARDKKRFSSGSFFIIPQGKGQEYPYFIIQTFDVFQKLLCSFGVHVP